MAAARCELAAVFLEDLRGVDARIRETRKKLSILESAMPVLVALKRW